MAEETFPYLFEIAADRAHVLRGKRSVTFGPRHRADVALDDRAGDQPVFQLQREGSRWFLQPLGGPVTLKVNQTAATGRTPLDHLAMIQAGRHVFVFVEHDDPAVSTSYATNSWLVSQLLGAPSAAASVGETLEVPWDEVRRMTGPAGPVELPGTIELPERQMLIGRDSRWTDICLPDVRVSRVHALIERKAKRATITDLKSANGTFVGGAPIDHPKVVYEGDRIQIGPYNLIFTGTALYPLSHDKNVELVARNLVRRVPDRKRRGQTKVILDEVSLVVRPRQFVCILGPSGSGKTTLLSALSARHQADEGTVLLNGEDLYARFDALKQNLAVVPQKDVLHDVLPLNVALRYTAKLRLPTDMSRQDIDERIDEMLDSVNLTQHQYTPIRRLSGGQVKRASWVNEAICNPSLFFLDEVTSGLDEQTDCEMMQLFRRMAEQGKTIICVTHSVTYVEQNCHLVAILAPGGVLAFFGPPADALTYFGIARLGDVYQRLKAKSPSQWKQQFRASPFYQRYIQRRLPDVPYERTPAAAIPKRKHPRELATHWRQLRLLTSRYLAIQLADKRALAMLFGQSVFIAALLVWLFGDLSRLDVQQEAHRLAEVEAFGVPWDDLLPEWQDKFLTEADERKRADYSSKILFLLCISCLWFGCNNAAKEIVKERSIYSKERDVGLKVFSYYGSKLVLLGALSVLQACLLYWTVRYFTRLGGDGPYQWLLLSLCSVTGVAIGLAISAIANTEDLAVAIVPVCLIPQIIMAGLIAPLLSYTRAFSQLCISAYWVYQGLLSQLDGPLQQRLRDANNLDLDREWTLRTICCVLLAHVTVLALVAVAALYARDRTGARPRHLRP